MECARCHAILYQAPEYYRQGAAVCSQACASGGFDRLSISIRALDKGEEV